MSDLRVGVVGLGARGYLAGHAHNPGSGSQVVAVADPDPRSLQAARRSFGTAVAHYADYRDLLREADLDAVIVMAPDHLHEEMAVAALDAGVSTYLEKPMAITVEGCDRILAAATRSSGRLYVGHNMRHMRVVVQMRELIRSGAIGQVRAIWCRHFVGHGGDYYFKDWMSERARTTGLLLQKGAHDIDVIHWLAGAYTRRVTAMGGLTVYGEALGHQDAYLPPESRSHALENWPPLAQRGLNPAMDVEDLSMMTMELDGGIFASYQQCHYTPDYWRNYTVIGTEGRLENFGDTEGATIRLWDRRHDYSEKGDHEFVVAESGGTHGGSDALIMAEFLEHVRTGGPTRTSPLAARQAVAAGFMATRSLRAGGQPMAIPALEESVAAYFGTDPRA